MVSHVCVRADWQGSDRSRTTVLQRRNVRSSSLGLCCRCHPPYPLVVVGTPPPSVHFPKCQPSRLIQRPTRYPPGHGHQLRELASYRLRFPVLAQETKIRLVVQGKLSFGCASALADLQYNYVLSAALDVGTALSGLAIFLFLRLPGVDLQWWGTQVYLNSACFYCVSAEGRYLTFTAGDWVGLPYLTADENGFGPTTWNS